MTFIVFLMLLAPDQKADLKAIDELHKKEVAATKAYDVKALSELWTDEVVSLPPGGAALVGKKANVEVLQAGEEQSKQVDIMDYAQKWEEVTIIGEYAYEWGTFRSQITVKATAVSGKAEFKVLRILKRQADGSWKIHRTVWNEVPPPQPKVIEAVPSSAAGKKP